MIEKYIHEEDVHNLESPREIVPVIMNLLRPKSVVDVGCGIGTFLHCFKQQGVKDVLGIDGPWVNKEMLHKHLSPEEFQERDLEQKINVGKKYDLVISLEVAEHLSERSADTFVDNLASLGETILFSAAIPDQGGQNHINEQWLSYWEEKFARHHYIVHDILKPLFWDNPKVFWWYKQNMVLLAPKDKPLSTSMAPNPLRNLVHYELFARKNDMIESIYNGELDSMTYIKCLFKSIFGNSTAQKLKSLSGKSEKASG